MPLRAAITAAALVLGACGGGGSPSPTDTSEPGPYRVQVTVTGLDGSGLVLQNNSGDDLSVSADGTHSFAGRLATDASYSVTVKTQPRMLTQTCTVGSGSGTVGRQTVSGITLQCVSQSTPYLYVANSVAGSVGALSVDAATGALTPLATRNDADLSTPTALAVDPVGGHLFIANRGDNTGAAAVSPYAITSSGGSAGTLTPGSVVSSVAEPAGLATSPDGAHLYVTGVNGAAGELRGYAIGAGGVLSAISGGTWPVGSSPQGVVVHPQGRFVYVANRDGNTISVFSRVAATGALTGVGTSVTASQPHSLAIDPGGRWLYVANRGSNGLALYAIDANTGALTAVETKILAHAPYDLAVHPRGTHLYAVLYASNQIATYTIHSDTGALTEVSASIRPTGLGPVAVQIDGVGRHLYVANQSSNTITIFRIAAGTGVLTSVGEPSGGVGTAPAGLALLIR